MHPESPGEWFFFKSPIYDPDGNMSGIIGSLLDITERITSEEKLRYNAKVNAGLALVAEKLLAGCGY